MVRGRCMPIRVIYPVKRHQSSAPCQALGAFPSLNESPAASALRCRPPVRGACIKFHSLAALRLRQQHVFIKSYLHRGKAHLHKKMIANRSRPEEARAGRQVAIAYSRHHLTFIQTKKQQHKRQTMCKLSLIELKGSL